jgi:hypothetical protein
MPAACGVQARGFVTQSVFERCAPGYPRPAREEASFPYARLRASSRPGRCSPAPARDSSCEVSLGTGSCLVRSGLLDEMGGSLWQ